MGAGFETGGESGIGWGKLRQSAGFEKGRRRIRRWQHSQAKMGLDYYRYASSVVFTAGILMSCCVSNSSGYSGVEWLANDSKIEFDAKVVPHIGLYNRLHWVEKNERSTSREYDLWEKADLFLLEWPGNVTVFDYDNPSVRWGRHRAKYIEDHCGLEHTGIEMRAYAYKFVYLTWGHHRLTKTYTPPLTVPRSILPYRSLARLSKRHSHDENVLNVVVVFDMAFAFDCLLLAYSEGVIRVSGLEMGWADLTERPLLPLDYAVSKGITTGVDRLVVQSCCLKTEFCPYGNFVVAYREFSFPHVLYISPDGGENFKQFNPLLQNAGHLRLVMSYPDFNTILLAHGNSTKITLDRVDLSSFTIRGHRYERSFTLSTRGVLQGSRLGMEVSFVLWDTCNVWYSPDAGITLTKSLFYIHKKIMESDLHQIRPGYCRFGENSTLAYGNTGKYGLLDARNVFFLGVDTKGNLSQLVALKMDMSLMKSKTMLSVAPYFDILEQPKLMYPPKFLLTPRKFRFGKRYDRRLAMRLLPKNIYPSDYILAFYEENAKIAADKKGFTLTPCQTSGLKVNSSITQKRKLYYVQPKSFINFTVTFKSRLSTPRQLKLEPRSALKFLTVTMRRISIDMVEVENPRYWIKYSIFVKPKPLIARNKLFRLTVFTQNALRCNYQPRVPIYIKVEETRPSSLTNSRNRNLADEDMSRPAYLKSVTGGETEYLDTKSQTKGETLQMNTCPLSKSHG